MYEDIDIEKLKKQIKEQSNKHDNELSDIPIKSQKRRNNSSSLLIFLKYAIAILIIFLLLYTFYNMIINRKMIEYSDKKVGINIIKPQISPKSADTTYSKFKDPLDFYYYLKLEVFNLDEEIVLYNLKDFSNNQIFLNKGEFYRFNLMSSGNAFCYIFQFDNEDNPYRLHPSKESFFQLKSNIDYIIPSKDAWIQADIDNPLSTLYILTSFSHLPKLDKLYQSYLNARSKQKSSLYASQLKLYIEKLNNVSFNGFRKIQLIFN